ncbi:hypothetical protein [Spongiactinospora sp. 9N601]|uniref:hypothetical protein n=1 Tax=Spongiactinospora sp. 9N601 TaxID=3375149 RepID=UPI0037B3D91C
MRPFSTGHSPSLAELQRYVVAMERARHLDDSTLMEQCLHLGEEAGEVCKAARKHAGLLIDPAGTSRDLGHELADALIFVLAIANRAGIDLDAAVTDRQSGARVSLTTLQEAAGQSRGRLADASGLVEHAVNLVAAVGAVCANVSTRKVTKQSDALAAELAEVLHALAVIANHAHIDLDDALWAKEEINEQRTWAP